ncbi:hypothetical protein B0J18DRAFT_475079 [Chaetomium sp. MPI-SDFR-AT-0129]|nr:hypothetical protein B0J18DRAFT_475079 [Chaetomium sp. MPI-SDFR-AT-0129]
MHTDLPAWMEPLPASLLLDHEIARKEALAGKGNVMTGCPELDEYVLLGGLERGLVVGVSAEEEMSMLVGFQILARLVAMEPTANVRVVTMLSMTELVPRLKQALVGQLSGLDGGVEGLKGKVQACFGRISISRIFDIEGLLEVLDELGQAVPSTTETGMKGDQGLGGQVEERGQPRIGVQDIGSTTNPSPPQQQPQPQPGPQSTLPDLVLITHTSSLLNTLFTGRDKDTAHNTAVLLGSHLRTLSHSPAPGGPLIILLNITTSSSFPSASHNNNTDDPGAIPRTDGREKPTKHPDPTLRSIFNPLPSQPRGFIDNNEELSAAATTSATTGRTPGTTTEVPTPEPAPPAAVSRNKPSFGLVFTQLLDVHLLCTRVPRTRKDREAIVGAAAGTNMFNPGIKPGGVSYVWVVEVLLDEVGVYEGGQGQGQTGGEEGNCGWEGRRRKSREQRWGVVDVDGLGRIEDVVW